MNWEVDSSFSLFCVGLYITPRYKSSFLCYPPLLVKRSSVTTGWPSRANTSLLRLTLTLLLLHFLPCLDQDQGEKKRKKPPLSLSLKQLYI